MPGIFILFLVYIGVHTDLLMPFAYTPFDIRGNALPPKAPTRSNTTNKFLAAFYPCYNHDFATERVLHAFRKSYPDSAVYMFNDGGHPMLRYVARKYDAKYFYHKTHRVHAGATGTYWSSSRLAKVYIQDLLFVAVDSKCDWVIILEDDVVVLRSFDPASLRWDLNGKNADFVMPFEAPGYWNTVIQRYIEEHYPHVTTHPYYSANGGSVFRGAFLERLAGNMTNVHDQIDLYWRVASEGTGHFVFPSDQVLFFLVQINNGSIGTHYHYQDYWWPTNWILGPLGYVHVIHGDKSHYAIGNA